ncbi:fibronectin type III domain-containing protein, partial [archaeon]
SLTYIIEKCENEFDDTYTEVQRTTSGSAIIHRLEPGQSYRFRVYGVNCVGIKGPPSESITVHTLLETPAAPVVSK